MRHQIINRLLVFTNLTRPTCLTSLLRVQERKSSFKVVCKMNEAFLRYKKDEETFDFTFRYSQPDLTVDRQFNLVRKVNENVETFLKRLDANMHKILMKKKRKRKNKNPQASPELCDNVSEGKIFLTKGHELVDLSLPCSALIDNPKDLCLTVFDSKYVIKFNVPWITELELPECILESFPLYPTTFIALNADKTWSRFTWFRAQELESANSRRKELSWEKIGEEFIYVPSKEDVGCRIKLSCVPCNEVQEGVEVEIEAEGIVKAGPGTCPFEYRHQFTKEKLRGKKIMSYNILADTYADSDYSREILFPYCPPHVLAINYRKLLIAKELVGYNSDIIYLQEVDKKIYEHDLIPTLETVNFSGIFSTKGDTNEGIAIFFDKNRFELLDSNSLVMAKSIGFNKAFNEIWSKIENEQAKKRFSDRNTTVLIATLRSLDNPDEILVLGNTHLYFHPDADHVKLLQGFFALTACNDVAKYTKKLYPDKNVTIILGGDFNSTPGSGIYELMVNKVISADNNNWKSNPEQVIENITLSHDLSLDSACGMPQYTNFTVEFADCLDYIFYEANKLEVTQIIPMPTNEELTLHTAIPSVVFPSDHIAIGADLKWK